MACTLIHEVAHSVSFALRGRGREGYFSDQIFPEMGCAPEKWLFDGKLYFAWNGYGEEVIMVTQMPSWWVINAYRVDGSFPPV